ncbi:hypothetical protein, partial [Mycobacterium tuberculosis]|uniref:hypothetical protein n=1 Tax=Mycobacterium tuberculosis TaxID=1773 RepID=UPI0004F2F60D
LMSDPARGAEAEDAYGFPAGLWRWLQRHPPPSWGDDGDATQVGVDFVAGHRSSMRRRNFASVQRWLWQAAVSSRTRIGMVA